MALRDIHVTFVWQAWRLRRWAGSGGGLGRRWSPKRRASLAWQAWRLVTSTSLLRGRRNTYSTGLPGSGGGLGRRWSPGDSLAWRAWRLVASASLLRGRRGAW
eukprot:s1062_g23.t1